MPFNVVLSTDNSLTDEILVIPLRQIPRRLEILERLENYTHDGDLYEDRGRRDPLHHHSSFQQNLQDK
jgi:hypothetical protein